MITRIFVKAMCSADSCNTLVFVVAAVQEAVWSVLKQLTIVLTVI